MEALNASLERIERNAEHIRAMQLELNRQMLPKSGISMAACDFGERPEVDDRSIYVGNVDYEATAADLEMHFSICGEMNRITIICHKQSRQPMGYAYIEFVSKESAEMAVALHGSTFRCRQIKVKQLIPIIETIEIIYIQFQGMAKRTNKPGMASTNPYR